MPSPGDPSEGSRGRQDIRPRPWRPVGAAAGVVLLVLAALYASWTREPPLTFAVLGFESGESDPEADWLPTALAEIVSARLRAHPRLRVLEGGWTAQLRRSAGAGRLGEDGLARLRADLPPALADAVVTGILEVADLNLRELGTGRLATAAADRTARGRSAQPRPARGLGGRPRCLRHALPESSRRDRLRHPPGRGAGLGGTAS